MRHRLQTCLAWLILFATFILWLILYPFHAAYNFVSTIYDRCRNFVNTDRYQRRAENYFRQRYR